MKIIVPMAGRGSRLRPHTLTVPKPLVPVAGVPIVEQLVREIASVVNTPITEVAYVIGAPAFFGDDVCEALMALAKSLGAKGTIYRQLEPLGTGHAIMCAAPSLQGPAVVAYADTLIRAQLELDPDADSVIWVNKVEKPEAFGVVELNPEGNIVNLVEKPSAWVSDLAVIGIYYFKAIEILKEKLETVVQKQLQAGEEYQINHGILKMMEEGYIFKPGKVAHWMDCGNPKVTLETNSKMLRILDEENALQVADDVVLENSTIIPPCAIAKGVRLINATVGPEVSIGPNTEIRNATVSKSLIQGASHIENATLANAMIGNHVRFKGNYTSISIGDYSVLE